MDDTEYAVQVERVKTLFNKWIGPLGLATWDISLLVERTRCSREKSEKDSGYEFVINADCAASWEYEKATITCYLPRIADLSDERLERTMIHEMLHCLLDELDCQNKDAAERRRHVEHVVSVFARLFHYQSEYVHQPEHIDRGAE
jgi:hypothetical protein